MAHFAELNENNIVVNVIVVNNENISNTEFPMSEQIGIDFLNTILPGKLWKQTSYNNNFRVRFAGIGFEFHPECGEHGAFCPAKPFEDWIFDNSNFLWKAPKPLPEDLSSFLYKWNPTTHDWERTDPPIRTR